ncbi:MAG: MBOAT family protein [Oscillospiraceae bacterium]|nr:MBOAT family protein [Candidatus Limimonas coprohippi]
MVFSSLIFIYLFLPITFILYFFAARSIKQKNFVLLIMSLFFYAWGEPKWILLMLISTAVEYFGAIVVDTYKEKNPILAKCALGVSVSVALLFLFIFKYYDFFTFNFNGIFGTEIKLLGLTLPIGISFYTFQTITYIVDVYRGKAEVQRSYPRLLLYVSMFPQLIAGPIVKYVDVEKQLTSRTYNGRKVGAGLYRFLIGLTKKAIFANIAGELATQFLDGELADLSVVGAWIGILSYTPQIYFDFSAYSDMAIGLGKIFGFDYPENFNYPYIAKSVSDFWKRWHISLTTFFREYLYIPLGGNRKHHVLNFFIVWAFTGLWHGASWNFILWGLYFYVLLVLERLFLGNFLERIPAAFGHIYTILMVVIGWVFFYFDDMTRLKSFFWIMFGINGNSFIDITDKSVFINHILFFIVAIVAVTPVAQLIKKYFLKLAEKNKTTALVCDVSLVASALFLLLIDTAAVVGSTYNPFLYFRF